MVWEYPRFCVWGLTHVVETVHLVNRFAARQGMFTCPRVGAKNGGQIKIVCELTANLDDDIIFR